MKHLLEAPTIHSTEEHKTEGAYGESDLHYFLDIDMAILGTSDESYKKYIEDLNSEYSFLDSSSYKILRKKAGFGSTCGEQKPPLMSSFFSGPPELPANTEYIRNERI